MRRHNIALGFILLLGSGTFFSALRANGQNTSPGTPVHMVVTVENRHGTKLPEITREDVVVTEGHDREKVTEWLSAIGEQRRFEEQSVGIRSGHPRAAANMIKRLDEIRKLKSRTTSNV